MRLLFIEIVIQQKKQKTKKKTTKNTLSGNIFVVKAIHLKYHEFKNEVISS